MIYLQNISESQVMFIPKNGSSAVADLVFRATSTIDLNMKVECDVVDLASSDLYYHVIISLPAGLPDGEYEYVLASGQIPVSSGLLIIGEASDPSQYNKDITYEQYETE